LQRGKATADIRAYENDSAIAFSDMRNSGQETPRFATTTYCGRCLFGANGRWVPYTGAPKSHTRREAGPESADLVDNKTKKNRQDGEIATLPKRVTFYFHGGIKDETFIDYWLSLQRCPSASADRRLPMTFS
jgi:hypothetical protein